MRSLIFLLVTSVTLVVSVNAQVCDEVPLLKLFPTYEGEQLGSSSGFPKQHITYIQDSQARRQNEVTIDHNGHLVWSDGPVTTRLKPGSTLDKMALVVLDSKNRLYVSNSYARGAFHHSSLVAGEDVHFAGEVEVEDGVLKGMNIRSGHYRPRPIHLQYFLLYLRERGVPLEDVKISLDPSSDSHPISLLRGEDLIGIIETGDQAVGIGFLVRIVKSNYRSHVKQKAAIELAEGFYGFYRMIPEPECNTLVHEAFTQHSDEEIRVRAAALLAGKYGDKRPEIQWALARYWFSHSLARDELPIKVADAMSHPGAITEPEIVEGVLREFSSAPDDGYGDIKKRVAIRILAKASMSRDLGVQVSRVLDRYTKSYAEDFRVLSLIEEIKNKSNPSSGQ